jgi:hypothetical protein
MTWRGDFFSFKPPWKVLVNLLMDGHHLPTFFFLTQNGETAQHSSGRAIKNNRKKIVFYVILFLL